MNLLSKANPMMSGYELFFTTAAHLELDGNSYWWLIRGGTDNLTGEIKEIWPLDPSKLVAKIDPKTSLIGSYKSTIMVNGSAKVFQASEILQHRTFNPRNMYRGMGTVEAAALAIDTDEHASKWNNNFFYNSALPSATLETDEELTPEQIKILEVTWNEKNRGVDKSQKMAILHSGLKFNPTNPSQRDMQFLESRRYSRDEILGIFRVPKMVLGIVEDVNRSNAEASDYLFAKRKIKPRIQLIVNNLNSYYLPLWGLSSNEYKIWFDDPVPENRELEIKEFESGIRNGYMTINEVRSHEGREAVEGGDIPLVAAGVMPLDLVGINSTATPPDTSAGSAADGTQGKGLKKNEIVALRKGADQRQSFIKAKIKDRSAVYQQLILQNKDKLIKLVKAELSKKSVTKGEANKIVANVMADIEAGWVRDIQAANLDTYGIVMPEAGNKALAQVKVNGTFDVANPRAVNWMATHALEGAKSVVGTVRDAVKIKLAAGIADGSSVDDIAASIATFFDQSDWRALRVARTEVIGSYAEGSLEGYRQSGVVQMKQWAIIDDDRVDDECVANSDQGPIPLDGIFESGVSAPPTHPNCRCSIQPVLAS
jgi:HK97 family phage portal protein